MVLRSVEVTTASPAERCDLCGRAADAKVTNRAFFILVTCEGCWADLKREVDAFLSGPQPSAGSSGMTRPSFS